MDRLLIMGAGGFGREVFGWARQAVENGTDWEIGGFLDANLHALDGFDYPVGIVGDPATYCPSEDELIVCAIGDPATRLRLARGLQRRSARFVTLIHPTAVVGPNCRLGEGCVLCPGSLVTSDVSLGDFVVLNVYATVGHDAVIGDGCTLSGHADVTGAGKLGEGVFMGSHAAVLPKAVVGDYAVVGAGSVVLRSARAYSTVMGVPAKQVFSKRVP